MIPSTFSIVAFDPSENAWGIAVASKFLAVGSVVPWASADAGAIATQSYANTSFGSNGLEMLKLGRTAEDVLNSLLAGDPQPELRQVGIIDMKGNAATYTGSGCFRWAGGFTGKYYAVQGNILVGEQVIRSMASAFESTSGSIIWRLYNALLAGDEAGGDRRGKQSAAIYIVKPVGGYSGFNDRWVDLRIDDDIDPVKRLGELLRLRDLYFEKSPASDQIKLSGEPLRQIQIIMARLGYYKGSVHGIYDDQTQTSLEAFIGNENFEDRTDIQAGIIDRPVLEYLIKRFEESF